MSNPAEVARLTAVLLREGLAVCDAATPGELTIHRYEHGGGRVLSDKGEGVADYYNEGDRELGILSRDAQRHWIEGLLAEVEFWQGHLDWWTDAAKKRPLTRTEEAGMTQLAAAIHRHAATALRALPRLPGADGLRVAMDTQQGERE